LNFPVWGRKINVFLLRHNRIDFRDAKKRVFFQKDNSSQKKIFSFPNSSIYQVIRAISEQGAQCSNTSKFLTQVFGEHLAV